MDSSGFTIVPAAEAHFDAILALERESGPSLVALTEGGALREAHARGHDMLVAMHAGAVAGWIWFGRSLERGGEEIGLIYRVAVSREARRAGAGRALLARAGADLAEYGCTRVRATVDGGDESARALFEGAGFVVDSLVMEREL